MKYKEISAWYILQDIEGLAQMHQRFNSFSQSPRMADLMQWKKNDFVHCLNPCPYSVFAD